LAFLPGRGPTLRHFHFSQPLLHRNCQLQRCRSRPEKEQSSCRAERFSGSQNEDQRPFGDFPPPALERGWQTAPLRFNSDWLGPRRPADVARYNARTCLLPPAQNLGPTKFNPRWAQAAWAKSIVLVTPGSIESSPLKFWLPIYLLLQSGSNAWSAKPVPFLR